MNSTLTAVPWCSSPRLFEHSTPNSLSRRPTPTKQVFRSSLNGSAPRAKMSGPEKYGWTVKADRPSPGVDNVEELPIRAIRRPLQGTRSNDAEKVQALMDSIEEVGLQEPIDVLLVEGTYYGFSGCHRYEACQRLGKEMILAKVRKANRQILKMHFM